MVGVCGIDARAARNRDSSISWQVSSGVEKGAVGKVRDFWNLNQLAFSILNLGMFWRGFMWRSGKSIIIGKWSLCRLLWWTCQFSVGTRDGEVIDKSMWVKFPRAVSKVGSPEFRVSKLLLVMKFLSFVPLGLSWGDPHWWWWPLPSVQIIRGEGREIIRSSSLDSKLIIEPGGK